jgi:hypothetical protein
MAKEPQKYPQFGDNVGVGRRQEVGSGGDDDEPDDNVHGGGESHCFFTEIAGSNFDSSASHN